MRSPVRAVTGVEARGLSSYGRSLDAPGTIFALTPGDGGQPSRSDYGEREQQVAAGSRQRLDAGNRNSPIRASRLSKRPTGWVASAGKPPWL